MFEQINKDLVQAMKEKDTFKLSVLRMLKSNLQLEKIAKNHDLDDSEVIAVLKKQVKLRKDSMEEYKKYNKEDLVASLEQEVAILANYLPEELSEVEIIKIVDEIVEREKPASMKDMGRVMKALNDQLAGKNADMSLASKIVKEKLSSL